MALQDDIRALFTRSADSMAFDPERGPLQIWNAVRLGEQVLEVSPGAPLATGRMGSHRVAAEVFWILRGPEGWDLPGREGTIEELAAEIEALLDGEGESLLPVAGFEPAQMRRLANARRPDSLRLN